MKQEIFIARRGFPGDSDYRLACEGAPLHLGEGAPAGGMALDACPWKSGRPEFKAGHPPPHRSPGEARRAGASTAGRVVTDRGCSLTKCRCSRHTVPATDDVGPCPLLAFGRRDAQRRLEMAGGEGDICVEPAPTPRCQDDQRQPLRPRET